ncbi:MAG: hypothetical protein Ct9H300mP16_02250 [Pseudomonadota bacterium]|nr:MAG: hypothetical protein Ct9H300mP16_02250 [Pseudomonadota bacterium]
MMAGTGDISAVAAMSGALPVMLTETYYSREFEREADQYAYDYLSARVSQENISCGFSTASQVSRCDGRFSVYPSVGGRTAADIFEIAKGSGEKSPAELGNPVISAGNGNQNAI